MTAAQRLPFPSRIRCCRCLEIAHGSWPPSNPIGEVLDCSQSGRLDFAREGTDRADQPLAGPGIAPTPPLSCAVPPLQYPLRCIATLDDAPTAIENCNKRRIVICAFALPCHRNVLRNAFRALAGVG